MPHFNLKAYGADRVVIGVRNTEVHKKIFQINFKSKDGSVFVSVPYAKLGLGRIGVVEYPAGNPESIRFGDSAPITTHAVKYAHHPDGEAHFSLDGKVFTQVRRKAAPLGLANGHLFTVIVQGLQHFESFSGADGPTAKRGIVSMPIVEGKVEALKFVAHLYSSVNFAKSLKEEVMKSAWLPVETQDGRRLVGVLLASKLFINEKQYLLLLTVEAIQTFAAHTDLCVTLMGGFDPPEIVWNHSRPMSFLMMMYPELADISELVKMVGSVDRVL